MIKQSHKLLVSGRAYMPYKKILLLGMVLIASISVFSCKRDFSDETTDMSIEKNIDMLYEKTQEPQTLDNFYFLPSTKEKIFEYKPEIIEKILNNKLLLQAYQEELGVDLEEEIIKYLNRKKNYDKSKIFSDVP